MAYYDEGQRDAYMAAARRFVTGVSRKDMRRVNILGASALDGFDNPALDILEDFLNSGGLKTGAIWGARSSLDTIKESGSAGVNWVVTAAALPLARYFQKKFGIPFVAGLPIGKGEQERILSGLSAYARGEEAENIFPPSKNKGGEEACSTLIVGEALFCSSLRSCLENEESEGGIGIGTFFSGGKELLLPNDRFLGSEDDAIRAFSEPDLKTLIADSLIGRLIPGGSSIRLIPVPHRAVSGRIQSEGRSPFFDERYAG
jgi:hypothetical protein